MKLRYVFVFVVVMIFASTGSLMAQFCLNSSGSCNSYYLSIGSGTGGLAFSGFEYGCSYNDREATGFVRIAGSVAYFGFTGSNGASGMGSYGQLMSRNVPISLSSLTGTALYTYSYISGGVISGHGGTSGTTLAGCSTPAVEAVIINPGPDEAIAGQ